jgi:hypothetical protein
VNEESISNSSEELHRLKLIRQAMQGAWWMRPETPALVAAILERDGIQAFDTIEDMRYNAPQREQETCKKH